MMAIIVVITLTYYFFIGGLLLLATKTNKSVYKMMTRGVLCFTTSLLVCMAATTHGFSPSSNGRSQQQQRRVSSYTTTTSTSTTPTSLNGFGDAFKGAFSNDDNLGKPKNEGLAGGPDYNENVTVNGKKVPGAVVGQKLTVVAGRVRVKIPVNCQQGDCGTCMVKLNGKQVKACQAKVPKGKCAVTTL